MSTSGDLFAPFRAQPSSSAILCDFDGTLAAIVDDPAAARPVAGAVDALADLAGRYGAVAVLSGRPVDFLQRHLPAAVELRGLYGLEIVVDGRRFDHDLAGDWRDVVAAVVDAARARLPAALVESKGLSVTLHYRTRPELAADVMGLAEEQAAASGLSLRPARMSVELHPPVSVDKGTALLEVAGGRTAACFIGDDAGDLAAFDALDELAGTGSATVRVAVGSAEAPVELLARADLVVEGPDGVVRLLRSL